MIAKFAGMDFAANFQTNHEEKHRHQDIVNPEVQVMLKNEGAKPKADGQVPKIQVNHPSWGIRPAKRHDGNNRGSEITVIHKARRLLSR